MSLIGTVYHNGIDKLCKQTKCFSLTGGTFNYFFSVILYATQAGIYMWNILVSHRRGKKWFAKEYTDDDKVFYKIK